MITGTISLSFGQALHCGTWPFHEFKFVVLTAFFSPFGLMQCYIFTFNIKITFIPVFSLPINILLNIKAALNLVWKCTNEVTCFFYLILFYFLYFLLIFFFFHDFLKDFLIPQSSNTNQFYIIQQYKSTKKIIKEINSS